MPSWHQQCGCGLSSQLRTTKDDASIEEKENLENKATVAIYPDDLGEKNVKATQARENRL